MKHRTPNWTPFKRGTPASDTVGAEIWVNSRYQVHIRPDRDWEGWGRVVEVSLKRRDKEPLYDWRDIQKIKNDFFGPEVTMIQVFPPESQLVDTANQYYFYVLLDSQVPFGFKARLVSERTGQTVSKTNAPSVQKPFEPHQRPQNMEEEQAKYDRLRDELERKGWPGHDDINE